MTLSNALQQFNLTSSSIDAEAKYNQWRDNKLSAYPKSLDDVIVEINNPLELSIAEKHKMQSILDQTNLVIYSIKPSLISDDIQKNKDSVRSIGRQFNIDKLDHNECADDDAITALRVNNEGLHNYYIPYSNKAINWHTDGYYNDLSSQIYSIILHCVSPAEDGGENQLLDPEMIYILLRDKNPDYIRALQRPEAMMIPKNVIDGELIRPDRSGPVFMLDDNAQLHMRYTARKKNVVWENETIVQEAEKLMREIMSNNDHGYLFRGKLAAGQGLLCRNVLHTRDGFDQADKSSRLLLRARYFDKLMYSN